MFNNTCPYFQRNLVTEYNYFIPAEETIVEEPQVYYPLEESQREKYSEIHSLYWYRGLLRDIPAPKESFTLEEAKKIGTIIGIEWNKCAFDVEHFRIGLNVELEHGRKNPQTNVTGDDPIMTGKIALAHLKEFPDYYIRLAKMEEEAKAYWLKI